MANGPAVCQGLMDRSKELAWTAPNLQEAHQKYRRSGLVIAVVSVPAVFLHVHPSLRILGWRVRFLAGLHVRNRGSDEMHEIWEHYIHHAERSILQQHTLENPTTLYRSIS